MGKKQNSSNLKSNCQCSKCDLKNDAEKCWSNRAESCSNGFYFKKGKFIND